MEMPIRSIRIHPVFRYLLTIWLLLGLFFPVFSQKALDVAAVAITVEDLDREVAFFTEVLECKLLRTETWSGEQAARLFGVPGNYAVKIVTLQLGAEQLRLMDFEGPDSRPVPADTRSNDLWFQHLAIVVRDMDAAYRKLLENYVAHVSTAPQTLPEYLHAAAGIKAFYFRDPEGHNLELIWFPAGKGNARWHMSSPAGQFLGIDHTAIGVSDTEAGMKFYRDGLGLLHGGHSENYGTEQEHLNQVFGARLDINGLHAENGIGIEFLRYIAPPGGRAMPADSKPTDLWHYHTEIGVDNLEAMRRKLEKSGYHSVSTGKTTINGNPMWMMRDGDGHAVLLFEK
ncbi:MAG: VOC family protein [Saprospiraceae bacterium]|nr:VOC family protein [Saprospiraceae bacterium]